MKLYGEAMGMEGKDGRKWVQLKIGLRMSCRRAAFPFQGRLRFRYSFLLWGREEQGA